MLEFHWLFLRLKQIPHTLCVIPVQVDTYQFNNDCDEPDLTHVFTTDTNINVSHTTPTFFLFSSKQLNDRNFNNENPCGLILLKTKFDSAHFLQFIPNNIPAANSVLFSNFKYIFWLTATLYISVLFHYIKQTRSGGTFRP